MSEVEVKLGVEPGFVLPSLLDRPGITKAVDGPTTDQLSATYYDTADLRLLRAGITLRRRDGGHDEGWHLKLPAASGARDELQVPLGEGMPPELRDLVSVHVRSAALGAAATIRTTRHRRRLLDGAGRELAELVDDDVVGSRVTGPDVRFREIEIEDRGGGRRYLDAVSEVLTESGATKLTLPKLARVLGPAALAEPEVPEPGDVRPGDPALRFIEASLCEQVRALMIWDLRVRRDEADAVHQFRVTVRRLRSEVRSFRSLLDSEWAETSSRELSWLAHELGPAREQEVLLGDLARAITRLPVGVDAEAVGEVIEGHYKGRLSDALARAGSALGEARYLALVERLVLATRSTPGAPESNVKSRRALPPLVWGTWKALRRRVDRISVENPVDSDYHRARIAAKRCRYTAEACVRVFGAPASHFAAAMEEIHDVLGIHQDAVIAATAVQALATQSDVGASAAFALGLLHADQRARAERARSEFHDRWPAVARSANSGWPRKSSR